ncbi:MAG: HAMP domain-containing protein [Candidatus Schekmanbacteria bacterium]|nr:HAMP domain-containing protein [Candidatus Schekmanbacteria bacterium]
MRVQTLILAMLLPVLGVGTIVAAWASYGALYDEILHGFDRKLFAMATVTAAFVDSGEHRQIMTMRDESHPLYRKYAAPMTRLMELNQLAYLYTFVMRDNGRLIIYVIDGTVGDEHSAIGDQDAPPSEEEGLRDVWFRGVTHLTGIKEWEQWGLLKSGFAPIRERGGKVEAIAGADVDVTRILHRSRVALLRVGLIGAIAMVSASFFAFLLARRLARPIAAMKDAALRVAAGEYGHGIEISSPLELRQLAQTFSAMSTTLARHVAAQASNLTTVRVASRAQDLDRRLDVPLPAVLATRGVVAVSVTGAGTTGATPVSGWLCDDTAIVAWAGDGGSGDDDRLSSLLRRDAIARAVAAILDRRKHAGSALGSVTRSFPLAGARGYVVIDLLTGLVSRFGPTPPSGFWVPLRAGAAGEPVEVGAAEAADIGSGCWVFGVGGVTPELRTLLLEPANATWRKSALSGLAQAAHLASSDLDPGLGSPFRRAVEHFAGGLARALPYRHSRPSPEAPHLFPQMFVVVRP